MSGASPAAPDDDGRARLVSASQRIDGSALGRGDAVLSAFLDSPRKQLVTAYGVDAVEFSGWVLTRRGREASVGIRFVDDVAGPPLVVGPPLLVANATAPRPDVAQQFDPDGSRDLAAYGFTLMVPVGDIRGAVGRLLVEFSDGYELARSPEFRLARTPAGNINPTYVSGPPRPENLVEIFAGAWSPAMAGYPGGRAEPFFDDPSVRAAITALGGVDGMRVLELGPLEAGHTTMLERHGAAEIVAIESSTIALLKCLVVKELVHLERASFLLGDFTDYLRVTDERFDLVFACGVLYHQRDPLAMLADIARITDRVVIRTAYYNPAALSDDAARLFGAPVAARLGRRTCHLHPIEYGSNWDSNEFCGGLHPGTCYLERDDLLGCLGDLGFTSILIPPEHERHDRPLGSSILIVATR